jgi:histidinol-phosphate aminotransferase
MGCLFANPQLIDPLQRGQNPFAVNSLALVCACIAIRYDAQVRKYAETIRANRAGLCRWLDAHEIPYVPSSANFVLTRVGEHAPEIAHKLRDQNILVRDWSYDPHLKGYLRFTIGSRAQTRRLMAELQRLQDLLHTRNGARAWKNMVSYSSTGWFA